MTKQEAINYFGGVTKLAKALGVSKQAVSQWTVIPPGRQYQLQVITTGDLVADKSAA